jgi:hypothetical protein
VYATGAVAPSVQQFAPGRLRREIVAGCFAAGLEDRGLGRRSTSACSGPSAPGQALHVLAVRKRGDAVIRAILIGVDTIIDLFPIIPHEAAVGVDCCGCMMPRAKGDRIELVCNECGIVEGSLDGAILRAVVTSGIQHAAGDCSGDIVVTGSGASRPNCVATNAGSSRGWSTRVSGPIW